MAGKVSLGEAAQNSNNQQIDKSLSRSQQEMMDAIKGMLADRFKGKSDSELKQEMDRYQKLIVQGALDAEKIRKVQQSKTLKQEWEDRKKQKKEKEKELYQEKAIRLEALREELKDKNLSDDERRKKEEEFQETQRELQKKNNEAIAEQLKNSFANALDKGIEEYASTLSKYSASINARLQEGSWKDNLRFTNFTAKVITFLGASPFVKQETMLDSLNELIQKGVNYNIEQRAFLQTVQDKIVTTFDAFDANLLNLIRLQQADSTTARMGMEASLTKSLNSMFKDTSYLSDTYDAVSQALFDTISQMGRNEGLEFEYVVQKWLGALGSVGVGSDTLTKIAAAINYLGTGDVESLQGDTAMQNLLVMAANRQGLDYAKLLTQGLNAKSTNNLLRGIVDYVREISISDNQVVRQQYGQLFGMSMADMVAALNLNTKELDTVQQAMLTYSAATKETSKQLAQVPLRMHLTEMLSNVYENAMASAAGTIAANPVTYLLWRALNKVQEFAGDIDIPFINAMGFGVDLNTGVIPIMKGVIAGIGMLGSIVGAVGSIFSGGGLNLGVWGAEEYLRRGSGFGGVASGYQATTSSSTAIVSTSGSDMQEQAVTAASEDSNEQLAAAKSEETATEKMLKAIMKAVTGSDDPESGVSVVNCQLASNATSLQVEINNKPGQPIIVSTLY